MTTRRQEMDALYASMPTVKCAGLCSAACGPIGLSGLEAKRIYKALGVHVGLKFLTPKPERQVCPALDQETNLCRCYDLRPVICRLYGVVERMKCPHGCVPERWVTDEEAKAFLDEAHRIGGWQDLG